MELKRLGKHLQALEGLERTRNLLNEIEVGKEKVYVSAVTWNRLLMVRTCIREEYDLAMKEKEREERARKSTW